jgi:hypothetical protein
MCNPAPDLCFAASWHAGETRARRSGCRPPSSAAWCSRWVVGWAEEPGCLSSSRGPPRPWRTLRGRCSCSDQQQHASAGHATAVAGSDLALLLLPPLAAEISARRCQRTAVPQGKIRSLEQIFLFSLAVKEYQVGGWVGGWCASTTHLGLTIQRQPVLHVCCWNRCWCRRAVQARQGRELAATR